MNETLIKRRLRQLADLTIIRKEKAYALFEEIHLTKVVEHLDVDCIFDIGANRGQYAQMLRKKVGFKGQIISFEPIPALAEHLRKLAQGDDRWIVDECAVSASAGEQTFKIMNSDQFSSLATPTHANTKRFEHHNAIHEKITVQTVLLDSVFDQYVEKLGFKAPFLKMDTQGHDLAIASAATGSLNSFVGVQTELAVTQIYEGSANMATAIEFFTNAGFTLSALVPNNAGHFPKLIEIDGIFVRDDTPGLR